MSVISKNILGTTTAALIVFVVAILSQLQQHSVDGSIIITPKEQQCLELTGKMFEDAEVDLLNARNGFTTSMAMEMTSEEKMYAMYPENQLKSYDSYCSKYGGKLHIIKVDFFDCLLRGSKQDVELTLKNFANCMAAVEECEDFGQEHLLQEAWAEMGLNCILEEEETKKDPPKVKPSNFVDDDLAKKEKEATARGADDVDREEKKAEYVPMEEQGKNGSKKKKKNGFLKFVLFLSICGAGYFVFDRRRRGLPVELPFGLSSQMLSGEPSRFARRPQTGFVSDYNLLSAEENTLQLSSNLA